MCVTKSLLKKKKKRVGKMEVSGIEIFYTYVLNPGMTG